MDPFIGGEAVASGALTRGQLRWNYVALHPNVYVAQEQARTLRTNTYAAWLWTGRGGVVAGLAAAGLHGVRGIADSTPIDDVAELFERYRGMRGLHQAEGALWLMDGGSESADETRLRLILVDAGLPRPRTSIVVGEGLDTAVIGMGWDKLKVGVSVYDGSSREGCIAVQHTRRQDIVQRSDWIEIQVADLSRRNSILCRVRGALRKRGLRV